MIKLDQVIFLSKMNTVTNCISQFSPKSYILPEITSSAAALENYRERFIALTDVLQLYKDLLLKDISEINEKVSSLHQVDQNFGNSILTNSILSR
jgi:hypothetical protein